MRKKNIFRLALGSMLLIGVLLLFGYIQLSTNGVYFHVKYSFPTSGALIGFIAGNGLLILGFIGVVSLILWLAYVFTER